MARLYIILSLLFLSCEKSSIEYSTEDPKTVPEHTVQQPPAIPADTTDLPLPIPVDDIVTIANINNSFGWDLFLKAAKGVDAKNVLISPLSVQIAMTMAANGAKKTTLEEMLDALYCVNCDVKDLNEQTAALLENLQTQSGQSILQIANGFFYDPTRFVVNPDFENLLLGQYAAGFEAYDFNDPITPDKINQWVKANTGEKIEALVEKIESNEVAFLVNALYFRSDWSLGFRPGLTKAGEFLTAQSASKTVDFLHGDRMFTFKDSDRFNLVDIPFKDSIYSLSLIQPVDSLASQSNWIQELSFQEVKNLWSTLTYERAEVTFPKMNITYDNDLKTTLKQLGVINAFLPEWADFTGLGDASNGLNLYVGKVAHKTVLKIDEKGAEGAAVTSFNFVYDSSPPRFIFDQPFVVVLRHIPTNSILYAGLINDPSL